MRSLVLLAVVVVSTEIVSGQGETPAARVVRFEVHYPNASLDQIVKHSKWNSIMRNSVLASLRFINKHWLICSDDTDKY